MKEINITHIIEAAKALATADLANKINSKAEKILIEAGILANKSGEYQFADYHSIPEELKEAYDLAFDAYDSVYPQ